MNQFQEDLLARVKKILTECGTQKISSKEISPQHEEENNYILVKFSTDDKEYEIYIYDDGAEVGSQEEWKPFEKPDFDSLELLADSFLKYLSKRFDIE